jgi:hypothetical protein
MRSDRQFDGEAGTLRVLSAADAAAVLGDDPPDDGAEPLPVPWSNNTA